MASRCLVLYLFRLGAGSRDKMRGDVAIRVDEHDKRNQEVGRIETRQRDTLVTGQVKSRVQQNFSEQGNHGRGDVGTVA